MSNCSFVYDTRVPFKNNIRYWRQHYTKSIKMVIQTQCYLLSICLNRSNKTYHYLNSTKLYLHFDYFAGEKYFVFKYLLYPLVFRCPISFIRIYLLRVQTWTKPCIVQICKNFHYKQQKNKLCPNRQLRPCCNHMTKHQLFHKPFLSLVEQQLHCKDPNVMCLLNYECPSGDIWHIWFLNTHSPN